MKDLLKKYKKKAPKSPKWSSQVILLPPGMREHGPCEISLAQIKTWEDRVTDENVVYNCKFQIETI
jgi:hypothetical protein